MGHRSSRESSRHLTFILYQNGVHQYLINERETAPLEVGDLLMAVQFPAPSNLAGLHRILK